MKEIKTKQSKKDIKVLDKATDVSYRAKKTYIRTKEQSEQIGHNDDSNYVDYAGNNVREGVETIICKGGHIAEDYGKNAVKKVQNRGVQNALQSRAKEIIKRKFTLSRPGGLSKHRFVQSREKLQFAKTNATRMANKNVVQTQARQTSGHIAAQTPQRSIFQATEKTAVQTIHSSSKTGHAIKQSIITGDKVIKETNKGIIKTMQKSVKTAGHTNKTAIKTSQTVVKTAVKTMHATKRMVQTARASARVAAVSAKTAIKATVATVKAVIAAVNGLIALIAAGGWTAIVIILVICLSGFILGSGFGIFFSNECYGVNTPIMTEVISQLNEEFSLEIERIQDEIPHDTLDLSNNDSSAIVNNWQEILPVYAVKVVADPENGMDVATLDGTKVGILRGIFWDMNQIDYWIETVDHDETVTNVDEDGNKIQETIIITETILHIDLISKTHVDMIAEYNFNPDQIRILNELMQDEYQQLFIQLTGG